MNVTDPDPFPRWTRPLRTKEEQRVQLLSVVVSVLFVVELFFDGFPDSPDAAPWGEARRPLLAVAVGVVVLLALGVVQAKWGSRERWENSGVLLPGLGRCPAWFAFLAFGFGIVGLALYVYAGFRSLSEGGSLHVLARRAALMLLTGSAGFFQLISWRSSRGREDG